MESRRENQPMLSNWRQGNASRIRGQSSGAPHSILRGRIGLGQGEGRFKQIRAIPVHVTCNLGQNDVCVYLSTKKVQCSNIPEHLRGENALFQGMFEQFLSKYVLV